MSNRFRVMLVTRLFHSIPLMQGGWAPTQTIEQASPGGKPGPLELYSKGLSNWIKMHAMIKATGKPMKKMLMRSPPYSHNLLDSV